MQPDILHTYYQALMCDSEEQYEKLIKDLSDVVKKNKENPFAYNNLGLAYSEIGMLEEAEQNFAHSLKIQKHPTPYKNLGMMMERNEWLDRALTAFNHAIQLNELDPTLLRCRGSLYGKLGRYEEAIFDYTKAIALDPNFAYSYLERSNLYKAIGKDELATEDLSKYDVLSSI